MAGLNLDLNKLKNIKLTKEQQQFLALGIVLVAGLGYAYWTYGVKPLSTQSVQLATELSDKQAQLKEAKDMKRREVEYAERQLRVRTGEQFSARRIPALRGMEFSVQLNKIMQSGGMELVTLTRDTAAKVVSEFPPLEKNVATVVMAGDFAGLGNLLSRLSTEEMIYIVDELQIDPGEPGRRAGSIRASMKLVIYSTPQAAL